MFSRFFTSLFFVALLFSLTGCLDRSQPIPEEKLDFVGYWEGGNGGEIIIERDGRGSLYHVYYINGAEVRITADPANISFPQDSILFSGIFDTDFKYPINKGPTPNDNYMYMTIGRETYRKAMN